MNEDKNTFQRTMYMGANKETRKRALELRKNMTNSERKLWGYLRNKQVLGYKFRRQHALDLFIADFYCHEARLVIEIDGMIHSKIKQSEWDISRTAELNRQGIQVIRFTNNQVLNEVRNVVNEIEEVLKLIQRNKYLNTTIT